MRRLALFAPFLLLLTACAALVPGYTAPTTVKQQLLSVNEQFTGAVTAVTQLASQGALSQDELQKLVPALDKGNAALDTAWTALSAGDTDTVLGQLQIVNAILLQLNQAVDNE